MFCFSLTGFHYLNVIHQVSVFQSLEADNTRFNICCTMCRTIDGLQPISRDTDNKKYYLFNVQ